MPPPKFSACVRRSGYRSNLKEADNGVSLRTARNSSGIEPSSQNVNFFSAKIEKIDFWDRNFFGKFFFHF
jgi:hypothetical protein